MCMCAIDLFDSVKSGQPTKKNNKPNNLWEIIEKKKNKNKRKNKIQIIPGNAKP